MNKSSTDVIMQDSVIVIIITHICITKSSAADQTPTVLIFLQVPNL